MDRIELAFRALVVKCEAGRRTLSAEIVFGPTDRPVESGPATPAFL